MRGVNRVDQKLTILIPDAHIIDGLKDSTAEQRPLELPIGRYSIEDEDQGFPHCEESPSVILIDL